MSLTLIVNSYNNLIGFNYQGYHNYHHAFPMDYATGEFGTTSLLTLFIELMATIGQAYNLRRSTPEVVERTKTRIKQKLTTSQGVGDSDHDFVANDKILRQQS